MSKLFPDEPQDDPACQHDGEALAGLLTLGKPKDGEDYQAWARQLGTHVSDLIRMVLDDDLLTSASKMTRRCGPRSTPWRSSPAFGSSGSGRPVACLSARTWTGWPDELLRKIYAAIGPSAIPILCTRLEDSAESTLARGGGVKRPGGRCSGTSACVWRCRRLSHRFSGPAFSRRQRRRGDCHGVRDRRPGRSRSDYRL